MRIIYIISFILMALSAQSQVFTVNGDAEQYLSCNCYKLTNSLNTQSGSVWNNNTISLATSFNYNFEVFLGCSDAGADGIAFMLQPVSTSVGTTGGGLGYTGIAPSIAVEIDTWTNGWDSIPVDHIGLSVNGVSTHDQGLPLVPATPTSANIEDCVYHDFNIVWDAPTQTISVFFDSNLRFTYTYPYDVVDSLFAGDPNVYWGFTGSTGGASNEQRFCIQYTPLYTTTTGSMYFCNATTVSFADESISGLNSISTWAWNFGDGTPTNNTQNPSHTFSSLGTYIVTLVITDLSGCRDTIQQNVYLNPIPTATATPVAETCNYTNNGQIQLTSIAVGAGPWFIQSTPAVAFSTVGPTSYTATSLPAGTYTITLTNDSSNCISTPYTVTITQPAPVPNPTPTDTTYCQYATPQPLTASGTTGATILWSPTLSGTYTSAIPLPNTSGTQDYYITQNTGPCYSDTIALNVTINPTPFVDAGADQAILTGTTTILYPATTASTYQWAPPLGLSDPTIANPSATPSQTTQYTLTVTSIDGCTKTDTVTLRVFDDNLLVPTAFTPDGDKNNDFLNVFNFGNTIISFKIFNRWGEVIYETNNNNVNWDGTLNGELQPMDTYIYLASCINFRNEPKRYTGNVTLLK